MYIFWANAKAHTSYFRGSLSYVTAPVTFRWPTSSSSNISKRNRIQSKHHETEMATVLKTKTTLIIPLLHITFHNKQTYMRK